ncbi:MAG: acylneuraminate cytidylyltransferase family protein [Rhodospirillales bacterium]
MSKSKSPTKGPDQLRILAVIPARGGSKGIPRKNLYPVVGKPLIDWTLEAAAAASELERTIVSTDDEEMAAHCRAQGADVPFLRPTALAADETPTLPVLQHALSWLDEHEKYAPDALMVLQPTSPLRTAAHIDEAIGLFRSDPAADSLVSCVRVPHHFHPRSVMQMGGEGYLGPYLEGAQPLRRQNKEAVFARNGAAIYISRTDVLEHSIFGVRMLCYLMAEEDSLDIDTFEDMAAAEKVLRLRKTSS